jgi:predicted TIM-barrel fold metal-dependent hydrolase
MIIDSHCHAGKGDGLTGPWDTAAPLDRYLRRAQAASIGRVVLLPAFHSDYRRANRQLGRIVASRPQQFIGYAMVHAARDAGRVGVMVQEAVDRYGFRGIKVHRRDARITREICEVARAFGLPVLYDVMGETAVVELVATEYPDVSFIIPHLGSFADDWRAHIAVIDQLVRYPNVYTDTAGVRRFDFLVEAVRRAGPEKVLFGSDGPWLHPGVELAKVRALGLALPAERLVLGGNLVRLLSRVHSGRAPHAPSPAPAFGAGAGGSTEITDPWAASPFAS